MGEQKAHFFSSVTTEWALKPLREKNVCCLPLTQEHPHNPGNPYLSTKFPLIDQRVAHTVQEHDTATGKLRAGFNFDPERCSVADLCVRVECKLTVGHLSAHHERPTKLNFLLERPQLGTFNLREPAAMEAPCKIYKRMKEPPPASECLFVSACSINRNKHKHNTHPPVSKKE